MIKVRLQDKPQNTPTLKQKLNSNIKYHKQDN
jgi:hypothetical protein